MSSNRNNSGSNSVLAAGAKLVVCVLLCSLTACGGGGGGGGERSIEDNNPPNEDNGSTLGIPANTTFRVAPDDPQASDSNDGYTQPFASLQHALDQLRPGDSLQIEPSSSAYRTEGVDNQAEFQGFRLQASGTADRPITIEGVLTTNGSDISRPVIDQGVSGFDYTEETNGLFLDCVSHVVVKNLEIKNVSGAGISTSLQGCASENIQLENNLIYNVYGKALTAGIRVMGASNIVIKDNELHDVERQANGEAIEYALGSESLDSIAISNNRISNTESSISLRAQATHSVEDLSVTNNFLSESAVGLVIEADDGQSASFNRLGVSNNRLVDLESGISIRLQQSLSQSSDLCITNNVFASLQQGLAVGGATDIEIYNNVFQTLAGELFTLTAPVDSSIQNSVSLFDYNLYWDNLDPSWSVGIPGGTETDQFFKLIDWQGYSGLYMPTAPDANLLETDPAVTAESDYFVGNSDLEMAGYDGLPVGAWANQGDLSCL